MVQHADKEMTHTILIFFFLNFGNVFVKCLKCKWKNAKESSPGALLYLQRMNVHLMFNLYFQ